MEKERRLQFGNLMINDQQTIFRLKPANLIGKPSSQQLRGDYGGVQYCQLPVHRNIIGLAFDSVGQGQIQNKRVSQQSQIVTVVVGLNMGMINKTNRQME